VLEERLLRGDTLRAVWIKSFQTASDVWRDRITANQLTTGTEADVATTVYTHLTSQCIHIPTYLFICLAFP